MRCATLSFSQIFSNLWVYISQTEHIHISLATIYIYLSFPYNRYPDGSLCSLLLPCAGVGGSGGVVRVGVVGVAAPAGVVGEAPLPPPAPPHVHPVLLPPRAHHLPPPRRVSSGLKCSFSVIRMLIFCVYNAHFLCLKCLFALPRMLICCALNAYFL